MRLENDFYETERISLGADGKLDAVVELLPEHPIYGGHFPSQAIVPGVCTLTIIRECLSKVLNGRMSFAEIKECKYVSALLPAKGLRVRLDFTLTGLSLKGCAVRCDDGQTVLKLKATLKND